MVVGFLTALVALGAADVAVAGDTWELQARGWCRITLTGWIAIGVAVFGFALSTFSAHQKYEGEKARRTAAIDEIDLAWRGVVALYRLMLWEVNREHSNPDKAVIEWMMQDRALRRLNEINLHGDAPHHHRLWTENICSAAKKGLRRSAPRIGDLYRHRRCRFSHEDEGRSHRLHDPVDDDACAMREMGDRSRLSASSRKRDQLSGTASVPKRGARPANRA